MRFEKFIILFWMWAGFNTISYIEEYEGLNFKDTIQLLSQIFLIDIKSYDKRLEPLALKYQQAILSQRYLDLLEVGRQRLKQRYGNTYIARDIDSIYDEKYQTIERIRSLQYDENFKYKEPERVYVFKKEFI